MQLTADRLLVREGERLRAVAVVGASRVAVASSGGLEHLRHALEDVGFRDVRVHEAPPASWTRTGARPATTGLEWLVWLEATPVRSASLARDLTEELTIADAWPEAGGALAPFGWRRLTPASELEHRLDEAGVLRLRGADPDAEPLREARVRDGRGGFVLRPMGALGFAWRRADDGDGWILRSAGPPKTFANVAKLWGRLVRDACATVGLDPRIVLVTIACEAGAVRPDGDGFVKAPRTEARYPRRAGEGDPGDFARDEEDWRQSRGANSSHGLMQTTIATAVRARSDLFEGVEPAHYRTVLWSPASSLACGVAHLASFPARVLADPLATRITYASGSVRVPQKHPNLWGAVLYDELVPLHWIAIWNDAAALGAGVPEGRPEPARESPAGVTAAWLFAAFSLFALSVAAAWGASTFTQRAAAARRPELA